MINRADMLRRVSAYLTDEEPGYEFTHWTESDLETYFDLALKILTTALPELSRGVCTARAEGSIVELPPCCENLLNITRVELNGMPQTQPRRVTTRANRYPVCQPGDAPYCVDSWSYDPQEGVLYLTPPVPAGTHVVLTLTCIKPVEIINGEADIPARFEPVVFELMLYYAWGVDIESPASRDRSLAHYKTAGDLMGVGAALNTLTAFTRIPEALLKRGGK